MDYLPLLMAFSEMSSFEDDKESEISKAIEKIEKKILEQADLLCEKESLIPDEILALHQCHMAALEMKRREDFLLQSRGKEKELKDFLLSYSKED